MEKINGIVLENRKHNDAMNIVTLYTRSRGRVSFISPAGGGGKSKGRAARLLPLALVDCDVRFVANKELQRLGAVSTPYAWHDLYFNPIKSSMALFLSEFLNHVLRETTPDPNIWDFIRHSIYILDRLEGSPANFHIAFMISFLPFSGIQPDMSGWRPGYHFSLETGEFSALPVGQRQYLSPEDSQKLPFLARMNYYNMRRFRLNAEERQSILNGLLRYYAIHYPGADNLKSLAILHEVFS